MNNKVKIIIIILVIVVAISIYFMMSSSDTSVSDSSTDTGSSTDNKTDNKTDTKVTPTPVPTPTPTPAPAPAPTPAPTSSYNYIGCFNETTSRKLPKTSYPQNLSLDKCAQYAKDQGFKYFALQYDDQCWYGNDAFPSSGATTSTACRQDTTGVTHGAGWVNAVYKWD